MSQQTVTQSKLQTNQMASRNTMSMLQRKCACGQHTIAGGECAECRNKRMKLQRSATNGTALNAVPPIVHEEQRSPDRPMEPEPSIFMESRFGHDFSRMRVHTAEPVTFQTEQITGQQAARVPGRAREFATIPPRSQLGQLLGVTAREALAPYGAESVANGSLTGQEERLGVFEGEGNELIGESLRFARPEGGTSGVATAQPPEAVDAPQTVIRGDFPRVTPREYWFFDGETPANYTVSTVLSTNRSGGRFDWRVSPHLTLSSPTDPTPTVISAAPSAANRDAVISVRHTDPSGSTTAASYRVTVLAPESLTHLRNVDNPVVGLGYESEIHYSIHDQFGTVLPHNVPLNEEWTGPAVADFPGGNWTRPPACGAAGVCGNNFNPADWHDRVTGESDVGAVPAPVAPGHADAGAAAEHWPGDWRIGSGVIGDGRLVSSVTWQRNRGFARHT